jgi:predicted GNAT family N-acyltransferase
MPLRLSDALRIECHDWLHAEQLALPIRIEVFVEEQGVPAHLELDGADPDCTHVLAFDREGLAVATARLMPDGRIGRMAVRRAWRGQGVGSALLHALLEQAVHQGMARVYLHAQQQACDFYARQGFVQDGSDYLEAGIPHRTMALELADAPLGHAG